MKTKNKLNKSDFIIPAVAVVLSIGFVYYLHLLLEHRAYVPPAYVSFYTIIALGLFGVIYMIIKLIQSVKIQKKSKIWRKTIKVGEKAIYLSSQGSEHKCEVIEIGENIVIKMNVSIERLYQINEKD